MYSLAIAHRFAEHALLVGLCDSNQGRLEQRRDWAGENGLAVPAYGADDFDRMIAECRPDRVIVATPDADHADYICRALDAGCDVITEKPMTTDAAACQRILDAQRRTTRRCTVTFNYRYAPPREQVKALLQSGVVGSVLSVEFRWLLDTTHGADYFRRWHRRRERSGGLLVHKATHHFDLVNWWISSVPETVLATGRRHFYTPEQADRYGLRRRGARCLDCAEASSCPFHLDLRAAKLLKVVYLDHEGHDGYWRDGCVFSDEIDIEDSMGALVTYASGATMAYSLNAFSPWEGYSIAFNGTKGRLEHEWRERAVGPDGRANPKAEERVSTRVFPHAAPPSDVDVEHGGGEHGGGDERLLEDLFLPTPPRDPLGRAADHHAGAWSVLTGIAANRSIAESRPVPIAELVTGLRAES
jgi:predicted dehydrogenase